MRRLANRCVIGLLRSPLHRLASGSLLLITYRGRRSGRQFTIPVMYAERDGVLTIFVGNAEQKVWAWLTATEDEIDAGEHELNISVWKLPDPLCQDLTIDRNNLRHVRDRVAG